MHEALNSFPRHPGEAVLPAGSLHQGRQQGRLGQECAGSGAAQRLSGVEQFPAIDAERPPRQRPLRQVGQQGLQTHLGERLKATGHQALAAELAIEAA